jgi:2-dehydro-3-deoxygluconokinase
MMGLRIACIGECMMELSHADRATLRLAYGGDTFNTALYLSRVGGDGLAVDYITVLGDDPYSDAMLELFQEERIGTSGVARLPGRLPGLYIIRVDAQGERRFFHYRSAAAARELFGEPKTRELLSRLGDYDLVYFSAITLSILSAETRARFADALGSLRKASRTRIAFDTNYRASGWPNAAAACGTIDAFAPLADILLPSFDDERALRGVAAIEATAARYAAMGIAEIVVKNGAAPCLLLSAGATLRIAPPSAVTAIDTTAAGDAFNAGYLAARLRGEGVEPSALAGHRLAASVIRHPGAIIPRTAMTSLGL